MIESTAMRINIFFCHCLLRSYEACRRMIPLALMHGTSYGMAEQSAYWSAPFISRPLAKETIFFYEGFSYITPVVSQIRFSLKAAVIKSKSDGSFGSRLCQNAVCDIILS
jgi:hypothetical protein